MSSVVISGDTSGAITLAAPAIAGTNTLSLPAQTATIATLTTPSFATTIGVGGATAAASGAGITFPASQSASSDANTLDDYEEGSWTPTVTQGFTSPAYSVQNGKYTKIGNIVYVSARLSLSGGTALSSVLKISLPFTVANNGSVIFPAGGNYYNVAAGNAINTTPIALDGESNMQAVVQAATNQSGFLGTDFGNTGQVNFTLVYQV
jgi:hypothetical protein